MRLTRKLPLLLALGALLATGARPAGAQYFGQNKVQYRNFDFRIQPTQHFDIYYYPEQREIIPHVARMAERWYERLGRIFGHELEGRQPLIFYASSADFRQTNAIGGELGEGTGGVTEGFRRRIIMPSAGPLAETDHVLGHELVHAFQYDLSARVRATGFLRLPLWFVEGLAEYLSLGPLDPQTAMWLRDALDSNKLPTLRDLGNPRFFPYRYGHAFWAYVGGRWGDQMVRPLFEEAMRAGDPDRAISKVLEISPADFSKDWREAIRHAYAGFLEAQKPASAYGKALITEKRGGGELNLAPALSPDGRRIVFLSERDLFSIDLFLAEAESGKVLRKLASTATDPHFDSLQFIESAGAWSADGRRFAQSAIRRGHAALLLIDPETGRRLEEIEMKDLSEIQTPSFSPDGRRVVFSALQGGLLDLWIYDLATGRRQRLTTDAFAELQPVFSPDGGRIAFVTDRFSTNLETLDFGNYRLALLEVKTGEIRELPAYAGAKHVNPQWSPDGTALYFLSDADGASNVHRLELGSGELRQVTDLRTGVAGITPLSPSISVASASGRLAFTAREGGKYRIYGVDDPPALAGTKSASLALNEGAALLPPWTRAEGDVERLRSDATAGLPGRGLPSTRPYKAKLGLEFVGQPTVGVGVDRFGTYVGGGSALYFSDMLGDHNLGVAFQVNGGFQDIAAQVAYTNLKKRFDWSVGIEHLPYISAGGLVQETDQIAGEPVLVDRFIVERQTYSSVFAVGALPFNRFQRLEVQASFRRVGFSQEIRTEFYSLVDGSFLGSQEENLPDPFDPLSLGSVSGALVHDSAIFGATSPILGSRARLEVAPNFGSLDYTGVLVDLRKYFLLPKTPVTLAMRAMQFGRYGAAGEDERFRSIYIGYPNFIRGYDGITSAECVPNESSSCPVYEQLFGSRMVVANVELRAPLFGLFKGRLAYGPLPIELALFADAGVAWTEAEEASFLGGTRDFVKSVGAALRFNVLGFMVVETSLARPFDRPGTDWVWQWTFTPGF